MTIHFIAIGGAAMHNLAIALKNLGHQITGSDDEIFEPSKSRLEKVGLLPSAIGWRPEMITSQLDAVIVGMHAREDNPELIIAKELGIKTYSYPEYVYEHAKNKHRIVIAGSHGKTTITSMILHVMRKLGRNFDYLAGAQVPGFDTMVRLSDDAPVMVIEGDEYFASPIDKTPKFLKYKHHIAVVSGIAWDHMNVYPTMEGYVRQFDHLADATPKGGMLIYDGEDTIASVICKKERADVHTEEYGIFAHEIKDGVTQLIHKKNRYPVSVFGEHNLKNLSAAMLVCDKIGISNEDFLRSIADFKGAANRLEKIAEKDGIVCFKDFAHAPSKVRATTRAVKNQFGKRPLVAVLELHTFSSLNSQFLSQYEAALNQAELAFVYFNPEVVQHKKLPALNPVIVASAFKHQNLQIFTDSSTLAEKLKALPKDAGNLLIMTSGNLDGLDLVTLCEDFVNR